MRDYGSGEVERGEGQENESRRKDGKKRMEKIVEAGKREKMRSWLGHSGEMRRRIEREKMRFLKKTWRGNRAGSWSRSELDRE